VSIACALVWAFAHGAQGHPRCRPPRCARECR